MKNFIFEKEIHEGNFHGTTPPIDGEYFTIKSDWNGAAKTVAANSEMTYTVTVTLIKTPTETIAGSFLVEFTAVAGSTTNNG